MKKVTIIITGMISLSLFFASCGDFLEPKSQSEFIPETADQLNELIISAIPDPSSSGSFTCGFLDVVSDDVETLAKYVDPRDPTTDLWYNQPYVSAVYALYTWRPGYATYMQSNGYSQTGIYSEVYQKLVYVNASLDYIDKVSGDMAMKNYVKAQAYTLRAFYYLHLVNIYGVPYTSDRNGPGVPIRTTAAKENRKMVRNTVGEVYDLVVGDLHNAIALFEELEPSLQYRQFRPTLPMALLLLSRAYLYMENWENAAIYSGKLISDWPRFQIKNLNDLVNDGYSNVHKDAFVSTNENVKRTQRFYPDFLTYANTDVIWLYNDAEDLIRLTAQEMYQGRSSRLINNETFATLTHASPGLVDSYDSRDLRLSTYLVRDLYNEPDYSNTSSSLTTGKYRAYGKLQISDDGSGVPSTTGNRFLPVQDTRTYGQALRITEAYLILAEAHAQLGNTQKATDALNEIWRRRFSDGNAPASYATGHDIVELTHRERRRELCFEALRWFDLRRWGMPRVTHNWRELSYGDSQTFVLEQNDPGYTFPVPESILLVNPDLTQVPLAGNGSARQPQ
ncbi:MAG: RagB/SusD family nutrient uptake outer membrane protein [Prevotella sp.]|nr:RagB/SusD family nutrient uptake outer membrane protein [Prevotella sp.]